MEKILTSIELYDNITLNLNVDKKNMNEDIYNFLNSFCSEDNKVTKIETNFRGHYTLIYKGEPEKIIVNIVDKNGNKEELSIMPKEENNWNSGFIIKGKYDIDINVILNIMTIKIDKDKLNNIYLHYINNGEKEKVDIKDFHSLVKLSTDNGNSFASEIELYNGVYLRFSDIKGQLMQLYIHYRK